MDGSRRGRGYSGSGAASGTRKNRELAAPWRAQAELSLAFRCRARDWPESGARRNESCSMHRSSDRSARGRRRVLCADYVSGDAMTSGKKKRGAGKSVPDFPALRDFFSGYLHQDFQDEYGSAAGAAKAFRNDASETEIEAVRREWNAWRAGLGKASADKIAQVARKLGAAWRPQTLEELDYVETALNGK